MKFGTIAKQEQVAAMARVLGAYCRQTGITCNLAREHIAAQIVALFEIGVREEDDLLAALILPNRGLTGSSGFIPAELPGELADSPNFNLGLPDSLS